VSSAAIRQIEPIQLSVCRITTFHDTTALLHATGFFYGLPAGRMALVTNWHVFSGRRADNPAFTLDGSGAIPNRIVIRPITVTQNSNGQILSQEVTIGLYDVNGRADWLQHSTHGHLADVAVIGLGDMMSPYQIEGINNVANAYDMSIALGDHVFILGYPHGFSYFIDTPIWKHGVIASEPQLETVDARGRIVIDATTRSGMSGSPVIKRSEIGYVNLDGSVVTRPRAARLIGVYASRPALADPNEDVSQALPAAEIGFVYKSGLIEDVIVRGVRAPDYGTLP
jgi:hypothetical protein